LGQATAMMIQKNLNISPTLMIRPGFRFNVVVTKDLAFSKPYPAKIGFGSAVIAAPMTTPAYAQFAVVDVASVKQNTITAVQSVAQVAKQVQQYQTQLQQYQNMLKNTSAPAAYVWSQAQSTIDGLQNTSNTLNSLTRPTGGIDAYSSQFQNPNY
ncbi:hypothetical protein OY671_010216, partial [Metschnikowia pulcherrima]